MSPEDVERLEGRSATPGYRWVEVRDDRLTNRVRVEQVAVGAPDPEPLTDSPQGAHHIKRLIRELTGRRAALAASRIPQEKAGPAD